MFYSGIADESGSSIEQQIAAHRALGWQHMELRNIDGVNLTDVDDATFARIAGALADADMRVCCFASQLANWSRPITTDFTVDVEELRRAIPRMRQLQTPFIRCMSYPNDGCSEQAWRDEAISRLTQLARMAEEGGVTLVHENCNGWGGESPAHTLEMLERVNSPALKLVFDTGNPLSHQQNALEYLRTVIDQVVHVHIKDGKMDGDQVVYTFPGEGASQVGDCLRLLFEHGYNAGYSIEPHMWAVIHLGQVAGVDNAQALWNNYLHYGQKLEALYTRVSDAARI